MTSMLVVPRDTVVEEIQRTLLPREDSFLEKNVPVNDVVRVAILNRANELEHDERDGLRVYAAGKHLQNLEEILIDEFEDQIQLALASKGLLELHDVTWWVFILTDVWWRPREGNSLCRALVFQLVDIVLRPTR